MFQRAFLCPKVIQKHSLKAHLLRNMAQFSCKSGQISSLLTASDAVELNRQGKIKFLDGSWHLNKSRIATDEFLEERLPGSQYINIDAVADLQTTLPHMIPTAAYFAEYVSNLGISSDDHVVVYSTREAASTPRVWWMFRLFGHNKVSILDGGLPAWKLAGGAVETGPPQAVVKGNFEAALNPKLVVGWQEVLDVVNTGSAQILDARSRLRYLAQAPEPRVGLPSGHIPGSLSVPFTSIVKETDVTSFRSKKEIRDVFVESGVIFGAKTILSCGSGVTAAVLSFGLNLIGKDLESCPVYDGSWTEWGSRDDLPRIPAAAPPVNVKK